MIIKMETSLLIRATQFQIIFFLGFRVDKYDQKDLFPLGLKLIGSKLEEHHDLEDSGFSIMTAPKKMKNIDRLRESDDIS